MIDGETGSAPSLPVATVARRLGVAPTTLRTWDRRYGLGPSARETGTHRRYTPDDVARLEAMRRLVLAGVTPAEAARVARQEPLSDLPGASPNGAGAPQRFAGTGGRVLSLSGASPQARGLARAAMSLDADGVLATLTQAFGEHGIIATWDDLLRPLLVAVGSRWAVTGDGMDVEHLLSSCITEALNRAAPATAALNPRPVLLSCAPDDTHALPLIVLRAALLQQRVGSRLLGAATPNEALTAAVRRTGPAALVVWSQRSQTGDPAVFDAVPRLRPPTVLVAGGPGWPARLPGAVLHASSLTQAVELVGSAIRT